MERIELKCLKCGDVIWSLYPGHMRWCSCSAIAIDQDEYMSRFIGRKEDMEVVSNDK
ncbi:MAG: DUF7695 domain-containing protein [Cetobacterium sp.]|uniref:DUF7695 domain-containing protein n=1 Tax=Cetobacterium sp. TaxID=2071632 RepID=UPI003EE64B06